MKKYNQFKEDLESRRQELMQRQRDQMASTKKAISDKSDREELKKEIKKELQNDK
jgi:hypothetical protein